MFVLRTRDGNYFKVTAARSSDSPVWVNDLDAEPCPTISALGVRNARISRHEVEFDGAPFVTDQEKPPYRVPLMSEIREIPWNGLTVVSTFAGCGGSSTGYRMAGYRVRFANEFVPVAQASYQANAADHTVVDGRDVKDLTGAAILKAIGMARGELDVLDGSPPCQAFSTAGKREKGWGTERQYEHGASQKNEDLFFEFCRLRDELIPRAFVAENVSGLVKGKAKGYFLEILARLKDGYDVEAQLLDAQWLGVPQQRQRIIFVGVRKDLKLRPAFPRPLQYRYSVREALPWLDRVVHDTSGLFSSGDVTDRPSPTVTNGMGGMNSGHFKVEARVLQGDSRSNLDVVTASSVRPPGWKPAAEQLVGTGGRGGFGNVVVTPAGEPAATIGTGPSSGNGLNPSGTMYVKGAEGETQKRKFYIAELKRICGFPDDFELVGTYAQQWERLGNSVPPVMMMHIAAAIRDGVLIPAAAKRTEPGPRSAGRSTTGKPRKGAGKGRQRSIPAETSGRQARPRRPRTPDKRQPPKEPAGGPSWPVLTAAAAARAGPIGNASPLESLPGKRAIRLTLS